MSETTFRKSTAREYFESLVITVILALFGTTFIVQAFKIPTPSMEDNLLVGDHLLVNKFAFGNQGSGVDSLMPFRDVHRGDIIVFKYPKDPEKHYVKRVIGEPGDHLRVEGEQVFINGKPLNEPYAHFNKGPESYREEFPPKLHHSFNYTTGDGEYDWFADYYEGNDVVIPPGKYFAMGDNRDNSLDSRFWGFVPRELIVGKPLIIYWSFETDSDEYRETQVDARVRQVSDLVKNFFRKTRWSRTFRIIR